MSVFREKGITNEDELKNKGYYETSSGKIINKADMKQISKGGEGIIFKNPENMAIKIYHKDILEKHAEIEKKINYMVKMGINIKGVCWPKQTVYNQAGEFRGYIMEMGEGAEIAKSLFHPMIDKKYPEWNKKQLIKVSINCLETFQKLHEKGVIVGDVNPRNILVADDTSVYFVDTDSYQIEDLYKCNVGTPHFTPPELQGKKYSEFFRTEKHERFSVATLLFMILLLGKQPYASQGGGTASENIRKMNFSYPFYDDVNYKAPTGPWEFIWNDLPYDVQKIFYKVFKENDRPKINKWIEVFKNYYENCERGLVSIKLKPDLLNQKNITDVSISMNRRGKGFGEIKTELWKGYKARRRFAVLELSTKAAKLLIGDEQMLCEQGFTFNAFQRNGLLTNAGDGLNAKNEMDLEFFRKNVISIIKSHRRTMSREKIDDLYCVATAAYRSAINIKEVLEIIKAECGINVQILSKEDEAKATLDAFNFSKGDLVSDDRDIFLIDQGGGSTEIALFRRGEILHSYSLDLGTTALKNRFLVNNNAQTPIKRALSNIDKSILEKINYYTKNHMPPVMDNPFSISVGTVITKATNKKGNKKQHGTVMSYERICNAMQNTENWLIDNYSCVKDLADDIEKNMNKRENVIEEKLILRLGLIAYKYIMERAQIDEIVVSGTSLWYGIYSQKFHEMYELVEV